MTTATVARASTGHHGATLSSRFDIRPLDREALSAVVELVRRAFPAERRQSPSSLAAFFATTLLDDPLCDLSRPSFVAVDERERVVGFIASHPRRARVGERALRAACCSHLVIDPTLPPSALGMRLLLKFLSGPQDVSFSDSASDAVAGMWRAARGTIDPVRSTSWILVLRRSSWSARLVAALAVSRDHAWRMAPIRPLPLPLRAVPSPADVADAEPLTADALAGDAAGGDRGLRVVRDGASAAALLALLEQRYGRDRLVARVVRCRGRTLGSFVCVHDSCGVSTVLHVSARERDAGAVLDTLVATARAAGAVAIVGRLEPWLAESLRQRRAALGFGGRAVVHARDPAVREALASPQAMRSRLDGEWW
jgi:hypothetical protein